MAHICICNITIIGSDNGLLPGRRQAIIIWTREWSSSNRQNTSNFIQWNAFVKNVTCKILSIYPVSVCLTKPHRIFGDDQLSKPISVYICCHPVVKSMNHKCHPVVKSMNRWPFSQWFSYFFFISDVKNVLLLFIIKKYLRIGLP